MKKAKRTVAAIMSAVMCMSAVTAMSASASAEWVKTSSGYSYRDDETGKKLTGWQDIDGGRYYFNKSGIALTGRYKISGNTYYFNSANKGKMITGWAKIGDKYYYFGSDGVMRTGWVKISGKQYYFNTDGSMLAGNTYKINGKSYTFGTDGVLKATTVSASASALDAPMKNMSWGMSESQVIDSLGTKDYLAMSPMIMDISSKPMKYYIVDEDLGLCAYGYIDEYSSANVKTYKGYFTDAGWEYLGDYSEDTAVAKMYVKGGQYGAVTYDEDDDDGICMIMVMSPDLTDDVVKGYVTTFDDFD